PAPSTPSASASQQPTRNEKADEAVAAGDGRAASDDGAPVSLILGGIAVVAVLGGVVFAVVRRRGSA
ncbi:serine protease, partial [Streptomyces sp. MBT57]|nr:serine protease [Streptomyces sp. MBT57]